MKKTTRTARKILSVFLSVLMILTTMAVAAPGLALAATDGNKYYVKVYVNIYDGSDGYANKYSVVSDPASEFYGKPKNYSWATNDGWYGRINMTGFTVFGEGGEYDAQDVSAALLAAESDTKYVPMDQVTIDNCDKKAIATETYTFTLDSFPVEVFWINDENNWTSANTGFAIRKLTVATSEGGTEHTLWEGLAGSDSETYNYYGSITPTGIHTCFEDGGSENIADYPFYKAITTSSQRAWVDPYESNVYGSYYLNDYAAGGVNASFSEGVASAQSNVDFVDVGSTDTYYLNLINHSKTQTATIKAINNSSLLSDFTAGATIAPGAMVSYPISIAGLATEGEINSFAFTYTLSDVYESDDPADTTLAEFTQPAYIGSWNESDDASEVTDFNVKNDKYSVAMKLQTTEGVISGSASVSGNSATMAYDYWVDSSGMTDWTQTGLRFYVTENSYVRLHLQPTGHANECGTMGISGDIANKDTASFKLADLAYTSESEDYSYSGGTEATYGTTVTPTWAGVADDKNMTFYNKSAGWLRFAGNIFKGSTTSNNPGTINFNNMLWRNYNGYKNYFSGTINVYAFDKTELRSYVQQTLLDFAPMSLRYNSTAWNTYTSALLTAMDVLADQKTTQLAVNNAYTALKSAVEALQSTDNLVNQIDMLTHIQYVDDIGSAEANKLASRYVLVPLGEHTVPSIASYIGNGTYKNATNKKSNLTTNYTETDTSIDILNYYYWNIDYSQINPTIALVDEALAAFDSEAFSNTFKSALTNAKDNLAGLDQTTTGNNQPTSQEDVDNVIEAATDLLKHLEEGYEYCDYDANDDGVDEVTTVEATCTTDGYTSKTCTICGKEQITVTVVSAGHTWGEATKDEGNAAQHYYTCSACSETKYEDHSFNYVTVTEPTYEAAGSKKGTCTACGYEITAEIPQLTDSAAPVITIAGSSNEEKTVFCGGVAVAISDSRAFTLTVTKDGEEYTVDDSASFTLSEAGAYVITATDASGNVATREITINAGHLVDSWTSVDADTHSGTCTNCGNTVTASHSFTKSVLTRPTLVDGAWTDGSYTYTCSCGATKVEPAVRADYTELEEAVEALEALKENENLTADAEAELDEALAAAEALAQDRVVAEQNQIDELVKELQDVKADVEEAISSVLGTSPVTEATSGIKVQFLKATGVDAVEYVQLDADGSFDSVRMRLTNGNSDLPITVTGVTADKAYIGADNTASSSAYTTATTIAVGNATDLYIVSPADFAETGIITYTINYTIDGLKGADDNAVIFETKAYLYVKGAAVVPYHWMHETVNLGDENSNWHHYFESVNYGDFEVVYNNKAPKDAFGNTNLVQDSTGFFDVVKEQYDFENNKCYAGCSETECVKGDAHAATYRYYIDTSLADTYEKAGLRVRLVEDEKGFYHNAPLKYVRLANNQAYLDSISGDDKTFSVTFLPSSSGTQGMTWTATSNGDMTVSQYDNPDQNNYIFGYHHPDEGCEETTAYANFSGAIPTETEEAKLLFSPRMEFNGPNIAFAEAVTMTTHLYITSYDKAELRQAVADAETAGYNSEYFDETKYAAYEEALKTAKEVLGKAETTQTEVDEATAALKTAIADLTAAEGEAKFILTVSHSIREGADMGGEITDTTYDYYLVSGEISPALSAEAIALEKINKYDAVAALTVTEDATHNYNYWYIDYSAVQDAIDEAEEILKDTETGYSDEYKQQVEEAKNDLQDILDGKDATTTPVSQDDVDNAIDAVTALTGHTCDEAVEIPAVAPTCEDDGLKAGAKCSVCGKITKAQEVDPAINHNYDIANAKLIARPELVDGQWTTGKYEAICLNDASHKLSLEGVQRADYTAFDEVVAELKELATYENFTDKVKAEILNYATQLENGTYDPDGDGTPNVPLNYVGDYTCNGVTIPGEQATLDSIVAELEGLVANIESNKTNENFIKPDFTEALVEWEEYLTLVKQYGGEVAYGTEGDSTTATVTKDGYIKDATNIEVTNDFGYLLENAYNSDSATAADWKDKIADMTAELAAINEGIKDGTLRDPNFEAYDAEVKTYNEKTLTVNVSAVDAQTVAAAMAVVDAIKANPDATAKDSDATIAEQTAIIKTINDKYASCAAGNHNWADATCTEAKTCTVCGATEGTANGHDWGAWTLSLAPTADADGTYTRTCEKCGVTEAYEVERENYDAYDEAVEKAENLLKNDDLTDAAKEAIQNALDEAKTLDQNLPADIVTTDDEGNETVIDVNENAEAIADTTSTLNGVIDSLYDENGELKDEYKKIDYSNYEAAVNAYENLKDTMTDADKAAVEAIIAQIEAIPEDGSKADYQTQLDKAAADIAAINAKYADCANGNHIWGEAVLTTKPAEGTQGEYTETCGVCGATQITKVGLADYTDFNKAVDALEEILANNDLTDEAKKDITDALSDAEALDKQLPADATTADGKTITGGQDTIDDLVAELEAIVTETKADIKNGSALKPDYKAWDSAETTYDDLDKTNVKAEIIAEAEELKADIASKQEDTSLTQATATQTQINEATARLNEIITGITDGSLRDPDYTDVENKIDEAKGNDNLNKDTQDKIEDIEKALEEIKTKTEPEANAKDDQTAVDALEEELDKILESIENGTATAPNYTEWDKAEGTYDALDKTKAPADLVTEATNLKNAINALKADDTANATEDQPTINAATTRLNEIITEINGILTEKPDFSGYDESHDAYEELVNQYGEKIKDSVASDVAALDAVVDPLRTDETATQGDDQPTIDNAKTQLDTIIAGINDGSLRKPDYSNVYADLATAKEKASANDLIDGVNTQITNIEKAIDDLQNDTSTNYKETQPIIDALEDRLEAIIEGIENGTLVKPDFTDAYTDLATAKTDAASNDVIDSVDDAIAEIEAELKAIEEDSTATKFENQPDVDALEKELEDIIAGIADGSLVKPVYTEAENAISNAEAIDSLTQEEQAAIEELKQQLKDIRNNPASNYKDNQDDVDALKNAAQDIVNKYAECESGNHAWGVPELTTKPAAGTQGEYTETCTVCGDTKTTPVDLADYEDFNTAVDALGDLLGTAGLTDEAKDTINKALAKAEALDKQLPADVVDGEDNVVIPGKQDIIDDLVAELEGVIGNVTGGISDGSLIKPDYTNVDADLADAKEKAEDNDVIDGVDEDIKAIEDALNNLKNDPETNKAEHQDDVDALEKELEDIIAGIADGSLVKPVYTEAEEAIEEAEKDIEGGKLSDEDKAALDEIKNQLEDIKENPASNQKNHQGAVDALKDAAQDIADKYSACANGNHSYVTRTVAPTCTEKGYDAHTCSVCSKTYKDNYTDANGHIEEVLAAVEPTCSSVGYTEGKRCLVCGTVTVAQQEIAKLPHTDADNDGTCDVCGSSGLYDGCACLCHNNHWFWRIVYLIFRLIWRVFGIHQVCACGAVHY